MKINDYLKKYHPQKMVKRNHEISVISDYDKDMVDGGVFVCLDNLKGFNKNYIDNACKLGAKTIILKKNLKVNRKKGINYVFVDSPVVDLSRILKEELNSYEKKPIMIGISGTSGKTSVSYLTYEFLKTKNYDLLYVGTHHIYSYYQMKEEIIKTNNTTISLSRLYKLLKVKNYDYDYLIMEVSSQGIMEHRTLGLEFDILTITNLSLEHLDYHHSLTEYRIVKGTLLNHLNEKSEYKKVILNSDDNATSYFNTITLHEIDYFGLDNENMKVENQCLDVNESSFLLKIDNVNYFVTTNLCGEFNIYNILNSLMIIKNLKFEVKDFINFINNTKIIIPGRMNTYNIKERNFIIDYAHTIKAVENVLVYLNKIKGNRRIITVIGCGGNRDVTKRPLFGYLTTKYSEMAIFTMDNPRDEDPYVIINDMVKDLKAKNYKIVINREEAIKKAIDESNKEDIILILGKGNEEGIITKNKQVIPYCDLDVLRSIENE